jgi:hypothetical protein
MSEDYSAGLAAVDAYAKTLERPVGEPITATSTSMGLGDQLWNMVTSLGSGYGNYDPFADPTLGQPQGLVSPENLTRHGLPMAGTALGTAVGGPVGAAIGGGLGELGGQVLSGQPVDWGDVGLSTALGPVGTYVGRGLEVGSRALENVVRGSKTAAKLGVRPSMSSATSEDLIPLPNLRAKTSEVLRGNNRVLGVEGRAADPVSNKLVGETDLVDDMLNRVMVDGAAPLTDANKIRTFLGNFMDANKRIEGSDVQALYGALMSDLRVAAASGSKHAGQLIHDLANSSVVKAMRPQNVVEQLVQGMGTASAGTLFGLGHGFASLYPLVPTAALSGVRSLGALANSQLPPQLIQYLGAMLPQMGYSAYGGRNPYESTPPMMP